jgi:hypothetical protein
VGVIVASGWGVGLLLLFRGSVFKELGSRIPGAREGDEEESSAMERACVGERSVMAVMFSPLYFLLYIVCTP